MHFFHKKYLMRTAWAASILLVFALVALIVFVVPMGRTVRASSPFGGMVTSVFYCSCSNNFRLTVSPPVGGTFMYVPGATIVYEYHRIPVAGVWLLGLYGSSAQCLVPALKGCMTLGSHPMIEMTGTSM